jgi:hypothetical protein
LAPVAFFFPVRRFADFLVAAIPSSISGDEVPPSEGPEGQECRSEALGAVAQVTL